MPSPEATEKSRRKPLLTMLFWAGVGLAPIAALLLLVGDGNAVLRIAAVLAILTVVLIGLSIALRPSADTMRDELEELLFDEIEELRGDLRKDIETAARATHKAFGEKLQVLYQSVEALRGPHDMARPGRGEPAEAPATAGQARIGQHPGTAAVPSQYAPAGAHHPAPEMDVPGGPGGSVVGPPRVGRRSASPADVPPPRPHVAGAAVRPAETVPTAGRQPVVGPPEPDTGSGNVYGGSVYGGRGQRHGVADDWSEPPSRGRRSAGPDEDSWSDQRGEDRRGGAGPAAGRYGRDEDTPDEDGYWSSLRSGERWAAGPDGEDSRELRMGERRGAAPGDEPGAELRAEDRWSAARHGDTMHRSGGDRAGTVPAGPVGPRPPTWDGPDREPVRPRRPRDDEEAYGYPPMDDAPRAGGARRSEAGPADDRSHGVPDDHRWR